MDDSIKDLIKSVALDRGVQENTALTEEEEQTLRNKNEMERKGWQVSPGIPWRRYFARGFDAQIGVAIAVLPLSLLLYAAAGAVPIAGGLFLLIGFISYALYLFIEALVIKLTGTTFGKFTMGITVITDKYDRSYTYSQLLRRNFLVFLKGLGLNIPIANIVAPIMAKSYVEDDESGQASWDFDSKTLIAYKELGLVNYILIFVNIAVSLTLIVADAVISR